MTAEDRAPARVRIVSFSTHPPIAGAPRLGARPGQKPWNSPSAATAQEALQAAGATWGRCSRRPSRSRDRRVGRQAPACPPACRRLRPQAVRVRLRAVAGSGAGTTAAGWATGRADATAAALLSGPCRARARRLRPGIRPYRSWRDRGRTCVSTREVDGAVDGGPLPGMGYRHGPGATLPRSRRLGRRPAGSAAAALRRDGARDQRMPYVRLDLAVERSQPDPESPRAARGRSCPTCSSVANDQRPHRSPPPSCRVRRLKDPSGRGALPRRAAASGRSARSSGRPPGADTTSGLGIVSRSSRTLPGQVRREPSTPRVTPFDSAAAAVGLRRNRSTSVGCPARFAERHRDPRGRAGGGGRRGSAARTRASRSWRVPVIRRTSTRGGAAPSALPARSPVGSNAPSCSSRSSRAWAASDAAPIFSTNSVLCGRAPARRPPRGHRRTTSVLEPVAPLRSQSMATNGPARRGPCAWMARAAAPLAGSRFAVDQGLAARWWRLRWICSRTRAIARRDTPSSGLLLHASSGSGGGARCGDVARADAARRAGRRLPGRDRDGDRDISPRHRRPGRERRRTARRRYPSASRARISA